MSVLPLVQLTKENFLSKNVSLRVPSEEVNDFGDHFQKMVDDLVETFQSHKIAVGLAAPQIGVNLQVAVININQGKEGPMLIIVNPRIDKSSGKKDRRKEACMSLPFYQGEVERREKVVLNFQDRFGKLHYLEAKGFLARVIFHETDHLQGVLYIDKMTDPTDLEPAEFFKDD